MDVERAVKQGRYWFTVEPSLLAGCGLEAHDFDPSGEKSP
jgi:hypothetical protein